MTPNRVNINGSISAGRVTFSLSKVEPSCDQTKPKDRVDFWIDIGLTNKFPRPGKRVSRSPNMHRTNDGIFKKLLIHSLCELHRVSCIAHVVAIGATILVWVEWESQNNPIALAFLLKPVYGPFHKSMNCVPDIVSLKLARAPINFWKLAQRKVQHANMLSEPAACLSN